MSIKTINEEYQVIKNNIIPGCMYYNTADGTTNTITLESCQYEGREPEEPDRSKKYRRLYLARLKQKPPEELNITK